MYKKFLLNYHWFAFSALTLVLGVRALYRDIGHSQSDIYFYFKFMNESSFAIFVIAIGIVTGFAYFPWPEKFHKNWIPALQTLCTAAMVMVWTLLSLGYFLDGEHFFIGFTGVALTSQILVRAYAEPYNQYKSEDKHI